MEFFVKMSVTGVVKVVIEADDAEEAAEIAEGMAFDEIVEALEDIDTEVETVTEGGYEEDLEDLEDAQDLIDELNDE